MTQSKKTILIVEDEVAMLETLGKKLAKAGFNVLTANDGEEGLSIALKEHPDLLMLDIVMPKMNGLAMAKEVREDKKWGSGVPIVLLTNLSDTNNVSEAAKYKIYDFLVKTDWKLDEVISLVKERLSV